MARRATARPAGPWRLKPSGLAEHPWCSGPSGSLGPLRGPAYSIGVVPAWLRQSSRKSINNTEMLETAGMAERVVPTGCSQEVLTAPGGPQGPEGLGELTTHVV